VLLKLNAYEIISIKLRPVYVVFLCVTLILPMKSIAFDWQ